METDQFRRFLEYWQDEKNSSLLYRTIAEIESNPKIAEFYRKLADTEQKHAEVWEEKISGLGHQVPMFRPSWRTKVLIKLAQRFGVTLVLPSLSSFEDLNSHGYANQPGAQGMAATEKSHARLLRQIRQFSSGGLEGGAVAQIEGRHRSAGGNALRAAVLGANDGLVSNLSLVMGVAGAELAGESILLTGLAGLLAGAISMALGEWISVQSSRELYQKQIKTEKEEIELAPDEEIEELALIYEARGLQEESARKLAKQIMSNKEIALEALSRDELGIDPQELGGSAWEAAITSFMLFALGAVIPVISFIFLKGLTAVLVSAALSSIGLFVIGTAITLFTGRPVFTSGVRQMLFGLTAALVTYLIGSLLKVSIAG
jgi:VIT1/CCC1 family predicted Fe2+/Mn2+ transporter